MNEILGTSRDDEWESRARYSRNDIIQLLTAIENLLDAITLINDKAHDLRTALYKFYSQLLPASH